jgi:hypothetical protein
MRALVLQGKYFPLPATQQNGYTTNLDTRDCTVRKLFAEKSRIPVVDKAPFRILIRLVETLGARIVSPLVADAVDPIGFATALDFAGLVHDCLLLLVRSPEC